MKQDEINVEITSSTSKQVNELDKLLNKFKSIVTVTDKVSSAMNKLKNSISPTTNEIKKLSQESSKSAGDLRSKLEQALNPKNMTAVEKLRDMENELRRQKISLQENIEQYKEWGGLATSSTGELISQDSLSKQSDSIKILSDKIKELKSDSTIDFTSFRDLVTDADSARIAVDILKEKIKTMGTGADKTKLIEMMASIQKEFDLTGNSAEKAGEKGKKAIEKIDKSAKKAKLNLNLFSKSTKGLGNMFSNFGKKAGDSVSSLYRKLKKGTLGLLAVRTAMSLLTRSVTAYLSFDSALQDSVSNSWNMLGSLLGPAIEYVSNMFAYATTYIYSFIKALTGIDLVARANAKALDTQSKKMAGSAKEAKKALAPFDEINNLNQNTGGSGAGSDFSLIEVPEINTGTIFDKLMKAFKEQNWYEAGYIISEGIADALDKIDWNKIEKKAHYVGTSVAQFLNGGVENSHFWVTIGNTLAGGFNTSIEFLYGFVETFNFGQFGRSLGTALSTAIKNIKWDEFFQTLSDGIAGLIEFLSGLLYETDYSEAQNSFVDGLFNVDPSKLFNASFKFLGQTTAQLIKVMSGIYLWELINTYLIQPALDNIFNGGVDIGKGFGEGIKSWFLSIGTFIKENIFDPFINGFRDVFKIHSPSKVMEEQGHFIIDGLKNGLTGIWDKVSGIFTKFKNNITNTFDNIKNSVTNSTNNMKNNLANAWNGIWNTIKGIINKIIGGVETLCNTSINGINNLVGGIARAGNKVLNAIGLKGFTYNAIATVRLPKLETGTNEIPYEGIYHLHPGEAVVPKKYNPALGNGYEGNERATEETNDLLRQLIEVVDSKEFRAFIGRDEVGKASVDYIRQQRRITGGSVI